MKKFLGLLLLLWMPCQVVYAQVLRPPTVNTCDQCNDWDSVACAISPLACEHCWANCGDTPGVITRVRPPGPPHDPWLGDYRLPQAIGMIQIAHEQRTGWPQNPPYMTNLELSWELYRHGFNVMKVWMDTFPFEGMGPMCWNTYWGAEVCGNYNDQEAQMREFWEETPMDVIFVRPTFFGWTHWEMNECTGGKGPQMALADYYGIAKRLYAEIGDRDITVILTDWEQDWIICDGYEEFLLRIIEQRQVDVERARREAWLELGYKPKLRVLHSVIVNRYPDNTTDPDLHRLAELIPKMKHRPDLIGLSYWRTGYDPLDTLEWLVETTGYPPSRIYIDEFGSIKDKNQVQRYSDYIPVFWDFGVKIVNIWLWKMTWCAVPVEVNQGVWKQAQPCDGKVVFTEPTDGYYVLQDLLRSVR